MSGKRKWNPFSRPAIKHKQAEKLAMIEAETAKEKARKAAEDIQQRSDETRRARLQDVARNRTTIVDPMGISGKADVVRKTLTGQ